MCPWHPTLPYLSIENDLIYKNDHLFIPSCLKQEAFDMCHTGHSGVRSTVQRMKLSCWWPAMSCDIERMIQRCPKCNELRPKKEKKLLIIGRKPALLCACTLIGRI